MESAEARAATIEACLECYHVCLEVAIENCMHGRERSATDHFLLIIECARTCLSCAQVVRRNDPFLDHTRFLTAVTCAMCAQSCERFAVHDPSMGKCAAVCRHCADTCRPYLHQPVAAMA